MDIQIYDAAGCRRNRNSYTKDYALNIQCGDQCAGEPDIGRIVGMARDGDIRGLGAWLDYGGNPDQYDEDGWTPLLAAAVRGQAYAVDLLINGPFRQASSDLAHRKSGALPIHFAGQSGNVQTAKLLLTKCPDHLDRIWELNGHTLFLQAVFYGHLALAEFALKSGANTAATTVRGLGGSELAGQFQNEPMLEVIKSYDSSKAAKAAYYKVLLGRIAPVYLPDQAADQQLSDTLIGMMEEVLARAAKETGNFKNLLEEIKSFVETKNIDLNRLGGPLQQPPLIVAVTGNNGIPPNQNVAELRIMLVKYLLEKGADPIVRERHPMGVHAIIRAAVFNHLKILQEIGRHMSSQALTAALNEQPTANGLTALHDTVLRATTVAPDQLEGYLAQIRWFLDNGADTDIEDYSGRTQRAIAEGVEDQARRKKIMAALRAADIQESKGDFN
ncbi:MAG: Ankrd17 protein [Firmicutes bacterium]|nr:Ankrd17 protein [Bacillota bacterium]